MSTRPVPKTGEPIAVIGMGTWQTFDVGSGAGARSPLREVLRSFSESGGQLVDSSPMYGNSEEVVGDLAQELQLRPKLFVATKVWSRGKAEGIRQMEASMRKLRVQTLDLMQVHNLVDVEVHLRTLAEWKEARKVRYVGITHYTASAHDEVIKAIERHPTIDFVQINYSVAEREAERKLLPLAQDKGIAVIANRPFTSGNLLSRLQGKPLPGWAADIDCGSWAQVLLKFVVSHPAVTCAIPATSKLEHLRDNMKAGLGRMPTQQLREKIAAL